MKRRLNGVVVLLLIAAALVRAQTTIPAAAIVHSASFQAGSLAPNLIFSVFLGGLTDRTEVATSLPLPTELAGVSIRIIDSSGATHVCRFFFASPNQANALVPGEVALGPATLMLTRADGSESIAAIVIEAIAPGIFTANGTGEGVPAAIAVRIEADGTQSREFVFEQDTPSQPFAPKPLDLGPAGDQVVLELFGSGLRGADPDSVRVFVNGRLAQVFGPVPQGEFDGLDQLNVVVPKEVIGHGRVDILITVADRQANGVRIDVSDANKPNLSFLTQYQRYWDSSDVVSPEPRAGDFQSDVIELPEAEGQRSIGVRVSLEELTEIEIDEPFDQPDPALLDELTLEVHLLDGAGNVTVAPVFIAEDALQSSVINIPPDYSAFQFRVTSSSPSLPYYLNVFVDLRKQTTDSLDRIVDDLEADGVAEQDTAAAQVREAKEDFEEGLQAAGNAERDAKAAKVAFDEGDIDQASTLLFSARERMEDTVAKLTSAKELLAAAIETLRNVPGAAAAASRVSLISLRNLHCVLPSILRMHYFIYENTFYDTPEVAITAGGSITGYYIHSMRIAIHDNRLGAPSVHKHEFGHAVFYKKTGLTDLSSSAAHDPKNKSTPGIAWKEGVATFLGQACMGDPIYDNPAIPFLQDLENRKQGRGNLNTEITNTGSDVEANVQSAMWDMFDGGSNGVADSDDDGFSIPFSEIWRAICEKPRSFDAFVAKLRERLTDAQGTALDAVLTKNGITP